MTDRPLFHKVPTALDFPGEEREVLSLWRERRVFERSLEQSAGRPEFVFYEGPPTANGLPHNGHVLTRVIKDVFPRYKTMRGFHVPRKAGWDTHGLPVEVEVEKELRIHGKAAIEAYGVEPFVQKCIESVFRYTTEWEHLTERVGFWVNLEDAYVTYHKSYVESVWWALAELFKKGLLYQGHKVVWWWAQGGTALSSGEVGQGYKTVDDPSAFVAFPLEGDEDLALLVWTTTPWTLSSNMYAAVHASIEYAEVRPEASAAKSAAAREALARRFVVARELVPSLEKKLGVPLAVVRSVPAAELVGRRYRPPFDLYLADAPESAFKVIAADFVTLDAGTGIVHIAPAFGEDDHGAHRRVAGGEAPIFCAVLADGTFVPEMGRYAGRWVKDCDKEIQEELRERRLLVHAESYRHDYPFCWRSDTDPLIQFARPAWYIKTTALIDRAIANSAKVAWMPEHIRDGRFGDFLANNVDWALSRERYWGTPLNIWVCTADSSHMHAPSSVAEIEALNPTAFEHFYAERRRDPSLSEHLIVHKPWIDKVTFPCPTCGAAMERVPEVIDCWFDSGCMPFAQWGFPHAGVDEFKRSFPADFISEAVDQTRGWFYSLLMIATLVFDDETQARLGLTPPRPYPLPYKTCIVLGHVCDKEGKKESKSKGNYTPPDIILDRVRMEFAVSTGESFAVVAKEGQALVAREDLEGLDLQDGARVRLSSPAGEGEAIECTVAAAKGLPRRVVVLAPSVRRALGAEVVEDDRAVKPVDVPRLPAAQRVAVEDPQTPAPGADAFRWFFYASNPPWNATRHSLSNVRAFQKETLIKLRNVYSFFTIYAAIDGFDPFGAAVPLAERSELDRWILGELDATTDEVTRLMDGYDVYAATGSLTRCVDALSNWYVRRSRSRFWSAGWTTDKRAAFQTLYEVLVQLTHLFAPFTPFASEQMFQNLVRAPALATGRDGLDSVHLAPFPVLESSRVDAELARTMAAVRELVSLGLQARTQAKQRVRQPLRTAHVILARRDLEASLQSYEAIMREELNVLSVSFVPPAEVRTYVEYSLKPNFRTLGQRGLGKEAQRLKVSMATLSSDAAARLVADLLAGATVSVEGVELGRDDVEIAFVTKEGFAAAGDRVGVVVLDSRLDDELVELGIAREVQNRIQGARKRLALDYADRIHVRYDAPAPIADVVARHAEALAREALALSLERAPHGAGDPIVETIDGHELRLWVTRA